MAEEKKIFNLDDIIPDAGIDTGLASLTEDKIEKTINAFLNNETGARLKSYVETCVHCGLCSDSCAYYLSSGKNPKYSPAGKVKRTLYEMIQKKGKVSKEFMRSASVIASTECNVCKRCAMYCPFGIDTAYMMLCVRRICHKLGITPLFIQDTAQSHSVSMNQMWVKEDEWIDTLQWQEEDAREIIPSARIPLDKVGSEFMYSVIAPEPKFQPQLILQAAIIFNAAGVDWTMPSLPGWDNSDMAMFTGDNEIMGRVKKAHFEAAMDLKVKKIVMGECGHAFRSVYDVGNRWLGWDKSPVPIVHAIDYFHELLTSGKIKLTGKIKEKATLHDPCNVMRGRGLYEKARDLMNILFEDFVDMNPNREHNFCCGAGGGVINCGPIYKTKRMVLNKTKADQIKETGAKILLSPCHNCHSGLKDINTYYELGTSIKFFSDIIYKLMEKPENA